MPQHARVVLVVAFAVSCSVDLAPPPDVLITCTSNDQCPETYRCSSQLGRCVPGGQEDVPPRILNLSAVVERDVGSASATAVEAAAVGSTVRVRFEVDEELLEAPLVRLSWPDNDDGFSRQGAATVVGSGYELVTTIAATDPVGAVSVSVVAVDLASNVGNAELPRHFLVDTTPFLLSSVSLRPRSPVATALTSIGVDVTAARNEPPGFPEVEAQLVFSKPPRQTPTVTLEGPGGSVVGTVSALATTSFVVSFEIDDGLTTAESGDIFELAVTAFDAAGIAWTLDPGNVLPTVRIDTQAPVMPTALRFLRAPWGAGDALPERTFAVESVTVGAVIGAASSDAQDRLFIHDAEGAGRARLGFTPLSAAGTLPGDRLLLATADRLEVFATLVDAAGNEGPTLRVVSGRWVATFKDRSTGNDFLNPNRLTRVSEPGDALFDGLANEAATADIAKTVSADGERFTHSVRSGVWRFRRLGSPPPQQAGGAVYVPSSGKVQLMGGSSDDAAFPNIWDWDGRDWREVDQIGTLWPGENFGPSVAHDSSRNRTVYHGGTVTAEPLQRTWEYDGTTWFDVTPTTPGPPAVFAPMVFDAVAGVSVLYGAYEEPVLGACPGGLPVQPFVGLCLSTTTWLWDGSGWEAVPCAGGNCPPARAFTSMAYDPANERVVLFGGTDSLASGSPLGDLWEWDTASRTWTDVTPTTGIIPSPRRSALMAYVGGFEGVVIWGGCEAGDFFDCGKDIDGSDNLEDVLVWKGASAAPAVVEVVMDVPSGLGTPLPSRGIAQAAYVPAQDRLIVFGGSRQLNVNPAPSCAPFAGACDGDDPDSKGGPGSERCVCVFDKGWSLQPTSVTTGAWRLVAAESAVHTQTTAFAMTYSPDLRRTFIFGGRVDDGDCDGNADNETSDRCHGLWSWDGISVRPEPAFDDPSPLIGPTNIVDATQCGRDGDQAPCGESERAAAALPGGKLAYFDSPDRMAAGFKNRGLWRYNPGGPPWWEVAPRATSEQEMPPTTDGYGIGPSPGSPDALYLFGGAVGGTSCAALNGRYAVNLGATEAYGVDSGAGSCLSRALWRWTTAGTWQLFLPANGSTQWPSPRAKVSLVEIGGGRLLLFGGCTALGNNNECSTQTAPASTNGDTWILTPGAPPQWTCISGTSPGCPAPAAVDPGPLTGSRLAWDDGSSRVLLFGGSPQGDGPGPNTLWSWREVTGGPLAGVWSEVVVDGARPLTRKRHGLVYDSSRDVLIVAGEGRAGEIWELGLDRNNRPVMVFDFALRAAGLSEVSGVERASDPVERIRLYLDVTSSGYEGGGPVDGIVVQMWNSALARWFDIGRAAAPGGSFAGVCNDDTDPSRPGRQVVCELSEDDARAMVFAGDDHVYARIAPVGGVGVDGEEALLALDAVRVEVEYLLP